MEHTVRTAFGDLEKKLWRSTVCNSGSPATAWPGAGELGSPSHMGSNEYTHTENAQTSQAWASPL